MKFHKTLVSAVIETLQQIFVQGVYADKAVEQVLKQNSRWGSRDRRFIAETTYEMVRWWRYILKSSGIENLQETSDYWKLFATWQILKETELPDFPEETLGGPIHSSSRPDPVAADDFDTPCAGLLPERFELQARAATAEWKRQRSQQGVRRA